MEQPAYLVLEDGAVFEGAAFGYIAPEGAVGEVVFTTAMSGYLETVTDPSYCGQIVVQAFPLVGNYGVIPADFESKAPLLGGYIVSEWCHAPSNFRAEGTLDAFLERQCIPGLCGIDTRSLVKRIRERGVMNGAIVYDRSQVAAYRKKAAAYRVRGAVERAGSNPARSENPAGSRHVALWDFGAKENILRELVRRDCKVTCLPWHTTAEEIAALSPDGLMLSNGPGDPAENTGIIGQLALLQKRRIPTFGICLGHQLLALAHGAKTGKLPYGHRGANQPVKDVETGRVYITSQNHGYAVLGDSLPRSAGVRFVNANDGTCEGVDYGDVPAFSVQFHPEGCAGPMDTRFLFDRFTAMMEGG